MTGEDMQQTSETGRVRPAGERPPLCRTARAHAAFHARTAPRAA